MIVGEATIRWRGHLLQQLIRDEAVQRLQEAADLVRDTARQSISLPYPPASRPGEPPHMRSGDLVASVFSLVDNARLTAIIGSKLPKKYGLFLEIGTRRMAARPWLRPALAACIPRIQAIFGRSLSGATASWRDLSSRSILLYHFRRTLGLGP